MNQTMNVRSYVAKNKLQATSLDEHNTPLLHSEAGDFGSSLSRVSTKRLLVPGTTFQGTQMFL